jgi:hypothetical protein
VDSRPVQLQQLDLFRLLPRAEDDPQGRQLIRLALVPVEPAEILCRSNDYAEPFAPPPMRKSPTSGGLSQPVGFVYHQAGERRAEVYR